MLDSESSLRLNLLRFPLIVGVVFIHAYSNTVGLAGGIIGVSQPIFIVDFVRNIVSQGIAAIAVPLFFLMSGYLFFLGLKWSRESYTKKLKSRTKTLIIPFFFWNIVTLLIFALAQSIPATQGFFSGKSALVSNFSGFDFFNAIIGFSRYPIAYQFWFIRDLIVLVLLSPLINIFIRFAPILFLSISFFYWIFDDWFMYAPLSVALLFFSVGAYLGATNRSLFLFDKLGKIIVCLYLVIVTIDVLLLSNYSFNPYLHKIGIILGVFSALFATKFVSQNEGLKLLILRLSSASFFVFAVHEPLLTIIKKLLYRTITPDSSFAILFIYFLAPTITIIFALLAYRWLSGIAPKFLSIVTGGR